MMVAHWPQERSEERNRMVRDQIEARGVQNAKVLEAMRIIPRHVFCPPELQNDAYQDNPLPIGHGQTISQPYIVAYMTEALRLEGKETVLEIGTGSGYQAAVLSCLAKEVYTVERDSDLASGAMERFHRFGIKNINCLIGDGTKGCQAADFYDAIIITAGAPSVPNPLLRQMAEGGRLLAPIGDRFVQELCLWEKEAAGLRQKKLIPVVFVPLIGDFGWRSQEKA